MIEIGRVSVASTITRRIAGTFSGLTGIAILLWLLRGVLTLQQYSVILILAGFSFSLLSRIFRTTANEGVGRFVVSLLWNITAALIGIIAGIWIFSWIASFQGDVFPTIISSRVPQLAIAAITLGLAAYVIHKSGIERKWSPTPFVVSQGTGPTMNGTKLTVKKDTVGMPIRRKGHTIGCVLLGDVSTSFKTPMGAVSASLPGPVTTVGIPFQGKAMTKAEVVNVTGKTTAQLADENEDRVRDLDVGPIKVRDGCMGDRWKIGPLIFDWDTADGEHHHKERWLAKGVGQEYMTTDGHGANAKWNGSSLSMGDGVMKLAIGSDSFSYSPKEVKTASPHHSLQVTDDKIVLETGKFTLKVAGDIVILRTETKTSKTESRTLANDLRRLLSETAKKQVGDVMEGNPIDLSEMFTTTEEALVKYE